MIGRREVVTLLGTAAAMWPRIVRAEPAGAPVIGFLAEASPDSMAPRVAAFRQGLAEIGYTEGHNITVDWRTAERAASRLPALAADLVGRRVAVIVTASDLATKATKATTATVPIVFLSGNDPRQSGLAPPPDRPRANITGTSWFGPDLTPARLGIVRQLVPRATIIGLLLDANLGDAAAQLAEAQTAADKTGVRLVVLRARNTSEIEAAVATLTALRAGALVVGNSDLFTSSRAGLIELSARHSLPAIYGIYEIAADGGLASYGQSPSDAFRRAGIYAGWILQGAKPADLPILESSKVELAINLKTAKTFGLDVPPNLLAGADEVIR